MPLFKKEEPSAGGPRYQDLRGELRKNKGALKCLWCHANTSIDLEQVQEDKKQRIFQEINSTGAQEEKDIFEEYKKGAVCKKCKGFVCSSCCDLACIEALESGVVRCPSCNEPLETLEHILD